MQTMHTAPCDRIVIKGHRIGEPDRDCEILEVGGPDSGPPYVVFWGETGHVTRFYPGSDARLHQYSHAASPRS